MTAQAIIVWYATVPEVETRTDLVQYILSHLSLGLIDRCTHNIAKVPPHMGFDRYY